MKLIHVLTAGALALLAVPAAAAALSSHDADYLKSDIQIQNGRYAMAAYEQQHGTGAAKKLAASVAAQAASDSRMLQQLAKRSGVTADTDLSIEGKYHYSQLVGLSGSELDKTFARELRFSDEMNQDTYNDQERNAQSATLKSYAKTHSVATKHETDALKHL